jgi:hypothetical protein
MSTYWEVHFTVACMFISRVDAMRKIQTLLRNQQFEEAIGLLRASRYVCLNVIVCNRMRAMFRLVIAHLKSKHYESNFDS